MASNSLASPDHFFFFCVWVDKKSFLPPTHKRKKKRSGQMRLQASNLPKNNFVVNYS